MIPTIAEMVLAPMVFVALLRINAPYGRFIRKGWGPSVPPRFGWILMESPSAVLFVVVYLFGENRSQLVPLIMLALWEMHYVNRAFVTPLLTRSNRRMPVAIVAMAFGFNLLNLWVNARWISSTGKYDLQWLIDPRFIAGVIIMVSGYLLNIRADAIMRRLRRDANSYVVPNEGPYRWITSPNYAGEIVEWLGWVLLTWSLAGLAFAVFTAANLVPRALAGLRWYRQTFPDFPPERRALIPRLL